MTVSQQNESFLLGQFREFYTEVIRLKQLIKDKGGMRIAEPVAVQVLTANGKGTNGNGTAKLPPLDPAIVETFSGSEKITALAVRGNVDTPQARSSELTNLTLTVWQDMIALFRRNALQILRAAGKPTDNYFEAQYVMAAFADDVFIHLDWEGKRAWLSNLLESTLFQTHTAGEKFFEKLDHLLRIQDPADRSLAAVYLNALSLGFRGKYHGLNDHGRLRRYRQELFAFIFGHPADLTNKTKVAFPDSYVQNLRKEERKKLTNPRVWLAVLAVVLVTYLGVSHGIWMKLTSRIERANQQIVELEKRLDSLPPPLN